MSKHIQKVKETVKKENNLKIFKISQKYIQFITRLNNEKKSSSKNFYIIIKSQVSNNLSETEEEILITDLNDNFFKIKECLSRCGNIAVQLSNKQEIKDILFSFFNSRKNLLS